MARLRITLVLLALALTGCTRAEPRILQLLLPRTGAQVFAVSVNTGDVTLTTSQDGTIHVDVTLTPAKGFLGPWISRSREAVLDQAVLNHTLVNGKLMVSLAYPAGSETQDVKETWSIALPPIMQVHAELGAGSLGIDGVAGGVEASVYAGKLSISVPYGAIQGRVDVGDLDASSHSLDYGPVSLLSGVGTASLLLNGTAAGTVQQKGPGQTLDYQGSGTTPIKLVAKAGKVTLSLSAH
ncbi:MAG TPA: hypothetical protein VLG68_10860 [Gammaproteobacteria bacterium]|nr:hypothetical protein [Gammaproteobacteria bacterium]